MTNQTQTQPQLAIVVSDVFQQLIDALQTTPDDAAYEAGLVALEELQTRIAQVVDDAKEIIVALTEQRDEAVKTANNAMDRQAELEDELSEVSGDLTTLTEALERWYLTNDERVRDIVQEISEQSQEEAEAYALEYAFEVTNDRITDAVQAMTKCTAMEALQVSAFINDEFEGPVDARTLELLKQIVAQLESQQVKDEE
jgi:hypothetical protein